MKRFISILLLSLATLIAVPSYSETVSWDQLVENPSDGLVYKKFSSTPFTGDTIPSSDDPFKRSYKDGLFHGVNEGYCLNGLLEFSKTYAEGKLNGLRKDYYCMNGQLFSSANYKDGLKHGSSKSYYSDGSLKDDFTYKNGKVHSFALTYEDRDCESPSRWNYNEGKKEGLVIKYHANCTLWYQGYFKDGEHEDGLWEEFFDNGKISKIGLYKDGKEEGWWEDYHYLCQNNLEVRAFFKNGVPTIGEEYNCDGSLKEAGAVIDGEKGGIWEEYYPDGRVSAKLNYQEGKQDGSCEFLYYDEIKYDGVISEVGTCINKKPVGEWKVFKNDWLHGTGSYNKDSEPEGIWKVFKKDGSLEKTITFKDGIEVSD